MLLMLVPDASFSSERMNAALKQFATNVRFHLTDSGLMRENLLSVFHDSPSSPGQSETKIFFFLPFVMQMNHKVSWRVKDFFQTFVVVRRPTVISTNQNLLWTNESVSVHVSIRHTRRLCSLSLLCKSQSFLIPQSDLNARFF